MRNVLLSVVLLFVVPGCVYKLVVAAEIGCKTTNATITRAKGGQSGQDAQCNDPAGPKYNCMPYSVGSTTAWDCTELPPEEQAKATRTATFKEEEYAPYKDPGTGAIAGQAFLKTRGGDVKYGAGNDITLTPATSYSKEIYSTTIRTGQLFESDIDDRAVTYMKTTTADGEGRFKFQNLAPGEYYAWTYISWEIPGKKSLKKTGSWVGAKITVADVAVDGVILKQIE